MKKRISEKEAYFWVSLLLMLVSNQLCFQVSRLFTIGRAQHSLACSLDARIPFLPWTISIYLGCLIFWFFIYRLIAFLPREKADRFYAANLLGKAVCFVVFVCYPTVFPYRPEVTGPGVWNWLVRFLYVIDRPDNLFPSVHCFLGWICWIGVRGDRDVPFAWRASAFVMAIAVCVSTLTTRQHELADVFGGILLSELCYALAKSEKLRRTYGRLVDRLLSLHKSA